MMIEKCNPRVTRRLALLGLSFGLASSMFLGTGFAQAADDTISVAIITKDGSAVVPTLLAENKALQEKFGINFAVKGYPSATTVWTGFAAGETDTMIGGAANFLAMANRGIGVHVFSTYANFDAALFGKKKIETAEDLRGKRVAAITAGLWRVTAAQIEKKYGLTAGKDFEVIPIPALLTGVTQVLAGTVDYAMGWEPETTRVMNTYPDLVVALSSTDLRPSGELSFPQVLGSYLPVGDPREQKMVDALAAMAEIVAKDPAAAEAQFASLTGAEVGVFTPAVESGRYQIIVRQLTETDKASLMTDLLSTIDAGATVPDGFLQ